MKITVMIIKISVHGETALVSNDLNVIQLNKDWQVQYDEYKTDKELQLVNLLKINLLRLV